jgi:N-carbamoylputrescine amidase
MTDLLPVALIQHTNKGDAHANLAFLETQIREAASAGAKLLLLQELHNSAYFCQSEEAARFDLAEAIPGPSTTRLGAIAAATKTVIVGSLFERRAPGLYHNTAVVIDADGDLAGRYRKMHVPDDPGYCEKYYFTPGDLGFAPIDTAVGRLGVLVCWDQWYPEAARLMALAGAELLLYPSAIGWDPRDAAAERGRQLESWIITQRAHAIANGLPVLTCNRVGFEPPAMQNEAGIEFWGNSFVCGPQGELLAYAGATDQVLHAQVDRRRSESVRRVWPFLRDRRPDVYAGLTKRFLDEGFIG